MTTVMAPQHLRALAAANETRLARAAVKRDMRAGRVSAADALDLPCVQSMRVLDLLAAQYRWGPARARQVLRRAMCSDALLVGALTDRQRAELREACELAAARVRIVEALRERGVPGTPRQYLRMADAILAGERPGSDPTATRPGRWAGLEAALANLDACDGRVATALAAHRERENQTNDGGTYV